MKKEQMERAREICEQATRGPWSNGYWSGRCRKPEHASGHPGLKGNNPCVYEYELITDKDCDDYFKCYVSAPGNVTLVGSDDHGPVLLPADARFIAESRTLLPAALAEIERLRSLLVEACDIGTANLSLESDRITDCVIGANNKERLAAIRAAVGGE